MNRRLFLIDAYALIYKYYYAFMGRPMRSRDGMNTSVVFGFTKFLRDLLKREKPDLIGVAFDPPGGSFRRGYQALGALCEAPVGGYVHTHPRGAGLRGG